VFKTLSVALLVAKSAKHFFVQKTGALDNAEHAKALEIYSICLFIAMYIYIPSASRTHKCVGFFQKPGFFFSYEKYPFFTENIVFFFTREKTYFFSHLVS
jgi:hypothetical protein